MKTEVSCDKHITESQVAEVAASVETGLARFADRLTRAEVHLKVGDGSKGAHQVECTLEVRPAGRDPVVVKDHAAEVDEAVDGAVVKMTHLLDHTFGRADSHRGGSSASGLPT